MIFELEDRVWNIALVGIQPGVDRAKAAEELVRLGENVGDPLSAHRILRSLPKQVKVRNDNLDEFKKVFETQEYFHHQRVIGHRDRPDENREVWVTLRDAESSPEAYFALIVGLISQPPWDKVLRGGQISLQNGVVITLDRSP